VRSALPACPCLRGVRDDEIEDVIAKLRERQRVLGDANAIRAEHVPDLDASRAKLARISDTDARETLEILLGHTQSIDRLTKLAVEAHEQLALTIESVIRLAQRTGLLEEAVLVLAERVEALESR
jgi:hypothetical protein